mmetsp:Transcript_25368/g.39825  ORF Transcript_25368/g.39825 Transcript_25368/m.39825 type:complete len:222 (-) Transcript_25368:996-1661(-)
MGEDRTVDGIIAYDIILLFALYTHRPIIKSRFSFFPPLSCAMITPFLFLSSSLFLLPLPLLTLLAFFVGLLLPIPPLCLRILVPHQKIITSIQCFRSSCQIRIVFLQLSQPRTGHLLSSCASLKPDFVKVAFAAVVLCNSNCVGDIHHSMPPPMWDKHRFTRILCEFVALKVVIVTLATTCSNPSLYPWQYSCKVMNCFIVLTWQYQLAAFYNILRNVGRK